MPRISHPTFHIVTTTELEQRRTPFLSDSFIFNATTKELRQGPGDWADCAVLIPAPSSNARITIDGELWEERRFVRTSEVNGTIILNLTNLVPGITDVKFLGAVSTVDSVIQAAGSPSTPLNAYQIIVADHASLEGIAGQEVLLTLAVKIG